MPVTIDPNRTEKRCGKCKSVRPVDQFYRSTGAADGRDARCIECRKVEKVAYREKNRARLAAAESARYYANREEHLRKMKIYSDANREARRASGRRHYANNKSLYTERTRLYEANKQEVFDEHVDRMTVFQRDEGICGICGKEVDVANFHVDHVVPLSKGGRHNYGNVQVAHARCNFMKHDRVGFTLIEKEVLV